MDKLVLQFFVVSIGLIVVTGVIHDYLANHPIFSNSYQYQTDEPRPIGPVQYIDDREIFVNDDPYGFHFIEVKYPKSVDDYSGHPAKWAN